MTPTHNTHIIPDFSKFAKVTDMIYYDGPLMSHYRSQEGEDFIFYWCDVDESYNKWFIIKVDTVILANLKANRLSLLDLLRQPIDGVVYLTEIDNELVYHNTRQLTPDELPAEYLPQPDTYLEWEDGQENGLEEISQDFTSGIMEFHLTGKNIEYGTIPLSTVAAFLYRIEAIRKSMVPEFVRDLKAYQASEIANLDDQTIKSCTQFDYLYSRAGSFSIILKTQNDFNSAETVRICTDLFVNDFTGLLVSASDTASVESFSSKYRKAIPKYRDMLNYMGREELSMDINWCNAKTGDKLSKVIEHSRTNQMIENLKSLNTSKSEIVNMVGKFYLIDIKNSRYAFESTENNDISSGVADEQLRELLADISFNNLYRIRVCRNIVESEGQRTLSDTLLSFECSVH